MSDVLKAVEALSPAFAGRLILPSHAEYHDARSLHNGMIDKRPALVAQCRGAAESPMRCRLARDRSGLDIAVRGGGHNVAGRASVRQRRGDRSVADAPGERRSGGQARLGRRRRALARLQPRNPAIRSGDHRRRRVDRRASPASRSAAASAGSCRSTAWRSTTCARRAVVLADGKVVQASADENPGSVLGDSRRWRQLRRRHARSSSSCTRSDRWSTAASWRTRSIARATCCGSSATPARHCPTTSSLSPPCSRRLMAPAPSSARWACCHSGSVADGERGARQPIKTWGSPVMDVDRPDAVHREQHDAGRRVPEGRAQLLEVALPGRR